MKLYDVALLFFFSLGLMGESWNGTVSDSHCGAKHSAGGVADRACIAGCIKGGGSPVFVVGDKVYRIDNPDAVKGYLGHKVTITGKLDGQTIHVDAVKL